MQEKILTTVETDRLLANVGAKLSRTDGETKVYIARQVNLTLTVFPGPKPDMRRVRVTRGCVC